MHNHSPASVRRSSLFDPHWLDEEAEWLEEEYEDYEENEDTLDEIETDFDTEGDEHEKP